MPWIDPGDGPLHHLVVGAAPAGDGEVAEHVDWSRVGHPGGADEAAKRCGVDGHRQRTGFVIGQAAHSKARAEISQCGSESVQVRVGAARDDVDVEGLASGTVGLSPEATDDQAVDAVVGEDPKDAFRVERVNWHVAGSRRRGLC